MAAACDLRPHALTRDTTDTNYGVSPRDPGVFAITMLLLLTVAIAASWFPVRRAARISPLEALREE